jgi:hypothetical protein
MANGKPSAKMTGMAPGRLGLRRFANAYAAATVDGQGASGRIKHALEPPAIVLINSCSSQRFGFPEDVEPGCGIGREASIFYRGPSAARGRRGLLGRSQQVQEKARGDR